MKNNEQGGQVARSKTKWWAYLGPGIITAAIVFGPSKITITSKMGASYGYGLIWLTVVAIGFMMLFTEMASRIAYVRKESLLQIMRNKWGNTVPVIVGSSIFLVTTSFQAGNSIGVGISIGEMTGTAPAIWIAVFTLAAISMLFFRSFYKILEKSMIALVILMLVSFIVTFIMSKPSVTDMAAGLVPQLPKGSAPLVIAFTASCFSIVAAFYQTYLVQERRKNRPMTSNGYHAGESRPGIILLGLLVIIVMGCAAAVLHTNNIPVNTAMDMAKALEPLFGEFATWLFLMGLFGASFSSLIGNAAIGGSLMGDALYSNSSFDFKKNRILIASVMIIGASIAIIFGKLPLQAIVIAQSLTIFIVPVIGISLFRIANDKKIMGDLTNTTFQKTTGALGLLLLIVLAIINAYDLFIR